MKILLVDDHEVVRIGLRTLLGYHSGLTVVGEARDAASAIEAARRLRPDIVLMDIRLPGESGIDACAEIVRENPEVRVIMLTSYAEDELLFEAIAAGAAGYVLKQVGSDSLLEAIDAVGRGESLLDPALTARLIARVRRSAQLERKEAFAQLAKQEIRILELVTQGKANKEIGKELGLGEKTVRNYVSSILAKLQLTSRTEAATYAVRNRIEDLRER